MPPPSGKNYMESSDPEIKANLERLLAEEVPEEKFRSDRDGRLLRPCPLCLLVNEDDLFDHYLDHFGQEPETTPIV